MIDEHWAVEARTIVKAELARRDITYPVLASKLKDMGVEETANSIANKISRGTFSAAFLLQVMKAIGCTILRLEP